MVSYTNSGRRRISKDEEVDFVRYKKGSCWISERDAMTLSWIFPRPLLDMILILIEKGQNDTLG